MNKSQFIFKAIDVVCEKQQNPYNYDSIYCIKNIVYSDKDEKTTLGDFYFDPTILKDGKKHPIILNIHGGGFVMGDKKYRKTLCEFYASKGYYVFNINYRMPPDVDIFGCIIDSIDAANYISTLAQSYNIDTDKIVLTGDSSGAYLAAYIAAVKYSDELRVATGVPEVTIDIAALILHSGPYSLHSMLHANLPLGIVPELASMLVGYQINDDLSNIADYKYFDYMSPIDFVNEKWPPAFISWSDSDVVCPNQGPPMAEKLMKYSPLVSTFNAEGFMNNHCFHLSLKTDIASQCVTKSIRFVDKILDSIDRQKITSDAS